MTLSGDPVLAIIVVPERVGDEAAIYALTEAAFEGQPHAGVNEQDVIDRLREWSIMVFPRRERRRGTGWAGYFFAGYA